MVRIGQGFDRHRLQEGRPLRIGGVAIPFHRGPAGHSDGDVLLHAVVNALLGAAGEGDIGQHFSDRDPRWAGADSAHFLEAAVGKVRAKGYRIVSLDTTVLAERPRLSPFREEIRERIATLAVIEVDQVNVKFGTGEAVGVVGRGEAVEAHAVVLIEKAGNPVS